MKYEVICIATSEWAFTVEADNAAEAEKKLQAAIDEGTDSEYPCQIYDTGTMEISKGVTSELV